MDNETVVFGTCKACKKAGQLFDNGFCESCQKGVEYIDDHKALRCDCGGVHFNLLKSSLIECAKCQKRFGYWTENDDKPVAIVVDNNQPGWTNIIETAPNVTLGIGTKLFLR